MNKKIALAGMGLLACGALLIFSIYLNKKDQVLRIGPAINSGPLLQGAGKQRGIASEGRRPKRRKDAILIKVKEDATAGQLEALKDISKKFELRPEKNLQKNAMRLHVGRPEHDEQEEEIAEQVEATGAVEFAEPDYVIPPAMIPNDALYTYQWHHKKIQSELAWNYGTGSSSVVVAVCDAGFDLSHPELSPRWILPGYNTVKNTSQIDDINDHGTMTSGTLAATGNNTIGVAGMAWQVRLLPIQISDQPDGVSTFSDVAECITYAKDHGAKVVNISYDVTYTSSLVTDAALMMKNAGGLVVVAAGNSTTDISSWGTSPNLIIVGATDSLDQLAWFTNFGTPVDLLAPGVDIYSTIAGSNYGMVSGTSFSTPVVAGAVALLYSLNPSATPAQIENYILSTLTNVGLSAGRLNVGAAVQKAAQDRVVVSPIVLDNLAPNVSDSSRIANGKWCLSSLSGSYGNPSVNSCGSQQDSYRFIPQILKTGSYTVSIRYLSNSKLSRKAIVVVKSSSGSTTKRIDMQSGGGQWVSLGAFNLSAGTSNYVEISDSAGAVNVDGVKFEPAP